MNRNDTMKNGSALIDDVNAAIRDNPLAAGLIGLGAAWFLFGGARSVMPAMESVASAGRKPMQAASEGLKAANDVAADLASDASDAAKAGLRSVADGARSGWSHAADAASEQTSRLKDYAGTASQTVINGSGKFLGSAQDNLRSAFERQPLLMGIAGAAVGAALASAFPRSTLEEEWLGEASGAARRKAMDVASEAGAVAQRVADEVSSEAQAQGLTAENARSVLDASRQKLSAVSSAATAAFKG
jgi:hypothetical protein